MPLDFLLNELLDSQKRDNILQTLRSSIATNLVTLQSSFDDCMSELPNSAGESSSLGQEGKFLHLESAPLFRLFLSSLQQAGVTVNDNIDDLLVQLTLKDASIFLAVIGRCYFLDESEAQDCTLAGELLQSYEGQLDALVKGSEIHALEWSEIIGETARDVANFREKSSQEITPQQILELTLRNFLTSQCMSIRAALSESINAHKESESESESQSESQSESRSKDFVRQRLNDQTDSSPSLSELASLFDYINSEDDSVVKKEIPSYTPMSSMISYMCDTERQYICKTLALEQEFKKTTSELDQEFNNRLAKSEQGYKKISQELQSEIDALRLKLDSDRLQVSRLRQENTTLQHQVMEAQHELETEKERVRDIERKLLSFFDSTQLAAIHALAQNAKIKTSKRDFSNDGSELGGVESLIGDHPDLQQSTQQPASSEQAADVSGLQEVPALMQEGASSAGQPDSQHSTQQPASPGQAADVFNGSELQSSSFSSLPTPIKEDTLSGKSALSDFSKSITSTTAFPLAKFKIASYGSGRFPASSLFLRNSSVVSKSSHISSGPARVAGTSRLSSKSSLSEWGSSMGPSAVSSVKPVPKAPPVPLFSDKVSGGLTGKAQTTMSKSSSGIGDTRLLGHSNTSVKQHGGSDQHQILMQELADTIKRNEAFFAQNVCGEDVVALNSMTRGQSISSSTDSLFEGDHPSSTHLSGASAQPVQRGLQK